jgi:hypothetical protein
MQDAALNVIVYTAAWRLKYSESMRAGVTRLAPV